MRGPRCRGREGPTSASPSRAWSRGSPWAILRINVADQRDDPGSVLNLTRASIALRRARPDLRESGYAAVEAPDGIWAWRRGSGTLVVLNHSDDPIDEDVGVGEILLSSQANRAGERIEQRVRVEPWEALVIAEQTRA